MGHITKAMQAYIFQLSLGGSIQQIFTPACTAGSETSLKNQTKREWYI